MVKLENLKEFDYEFSDKIKEILKKKHEGIYLVPKYDPDFFKGEPIDLEYFLGISKK